MKKNPPPPRFMIVVEATPGAVPPEMRLKRWLKAGLRSFGLRATFAVESALPKILEPDTQPDETDDKPN